MTQDSVLNVRLDGVTKLRLQQIASERGLKVSALAREILWERVREPSVVDTRLPGAPPTFSEARERGVQRLFERFTLGRHPWSDREEDAQLRWVRASITEMPELAHADASRILYELRQRANVGASGSTLIPEVGQV